MQSKIVLINQSSGYLVIDDLNAFSRRYEQVHLICGKLKMGDRRLDGNVKIRKICRYDKSSSMKRLITWIGASVQVFFILLFRYRKGWDVVYYTNPPMACFASLLLGNKFRIVEYDVYPEALKTVGFSERSFVYKTWALLKKRLYKKADRVFALSGGMKEILLKYGSEEKIEVVPLWSASDKFRPICKAENPFVRDHKLEDKFVVLYSGNIGFTHSVECLVEVAKRMEGDADIVLLVIGEGKKKKELQEDVERHRLQNVRFLPFQDFSMLPYSLASADIGVVTLDDNVSKVSVPSKTYNLMAVGAPLLAVANEDTEMFKIVNKYKNGRCIHKDEIPNMVSYIRELKENSMLKDKYSENSLMASKDFTYKNAEKHLH